MQAMRLSQLAHRWVAGELHHKVNLDIIELNDSNLLVELSTT